MPHFSHRALSVAAAPALALALAACGSTAINPDYTPGPTPNGGNAVNQPSKTAATKTAKATKHHGTTRPTARATHTNGSVKPSAPTSAPPPAKPSSGSGGGAHHVTSTAATITVTPSSGLIDGQTVTIRGTHFNPKIKVIAVECVNKGNNTQAGNCNINIFSLPKGFYPAADGTFTTTLKVRKSFGSNTCSSSTPCLVSVTEPNNNPSEEADAPISFR